MNIHELLSRFERVVKSGDSWSASCPAPTHGGPDRNPSLTISENADGRILMHCQKGSCSFDDVCVGLGVDPKDLNGRSEQKPRGEWTPRGEAIAVYDYTDEAGRLLFQVCRTADKQFPQRCPDPAKASGWRWSLGDTRRVLYRLPAVLSAVEDGRTVFLVEGEKDVHAVEAAGEVATCSPGGAGKWKAEYAESLTGAHEVIVVADRDEVGSKHARQVASSLRPLVGRVLIVEAFAGKDAADHLAAGHSIDDFQITDEPSEGGQSDLAPDVYEFVAGEDAYDWVVPGLLERGERVMFTGVPGIGKTELARTFMIAVAAGVHPFDPTVRIEPRKVLYIDCENMARLLRRRFRRLLGQVNARRRVGEGMLRIIDRPAGLDLLNGDDQAWLVERVVAHRPDVLFLGPIYRLHTADPVDERQARIVASAIDAARLRVDCAVILEAHSPTGEGLASVRPFGSSLWQRWPDFGYGLRPASEPKALAGSVDVVPWRGPRDDEREWPARLLRGQEWPWVAPMETVWRLGGVTHPEQPTLAVEAPLSGAGF